MSFIRRFLHDLVAISKRKRYKLRTHLPTMRSPSVPIDTVSRRRRRLWKQQAQQRYERVMQILNSDGCYNVTYDFIRKRGLGQQRALAKLRHMLREARFMQSRLAEPPYVLWGILAAATFYGQRQPGKIVGRASHQITVTNSSINGS
jgi:hypothetical protein